jgi:hypothetical protein
MTELSRLLDSYDRYSEASVDAIVPIGEDVGVPRYVYVDLDEPWLPYLARAVVEGTLTGPRCIDLRLVARPDGDPVTPEGLRRVPLGRVVREVERQPIVLHRVSMRDAIGEGVAWGASGAGEQARRDRAAYRRALDRQRAERRRWRLDDATLRKVAAVYRKALAVGRPPTAAVQQHFRLARRGQAAKWVQRTRQEGHLGPAPGRRRKGEVPSE